MSELKKDEEKERVSKRMRPSRGEDDTSNSNTTSETQSQDKGYRENPKQRRSRSNGTSNSQDKGYEMKPSVNLSQLSSSQVEEEYWELHQHYKTLLKRHPVATDRSQELKSKIQKMRNRMKKMSKHIDVGDLLKRKSQGEGSSESQEPMEKRRQRKDNSENQEQGYEKKR